MPPILWKTLNGFSRLLFLAVIFFYPAAGQYRFDQWTADNGLPQNSVYAIKQTRDGYLWLATVDGLARFDGVRFTIFNKSNSPGIVNNRFTGLFEDRNGDLWAVTEESDVIRYRHGQFTSYGVESNLPQVSQVSGDVDGNPIILLNNSEVYRFSDGRFSVFNVETTSQQTTLDPNLESLDSFCFSEAEKKQLTCLWNGQLVKVPFPLGSSSLTILNIAQDGEGTLWLQTSEQGVIHLENGKIAKIYTKQDGLPETPLLLVSGEQVTLLSKDRQGAFWLMDLKTMRNELLGQPPTSLLTDLHTGYVDREGNLWLGNLRGGLFRIRKQVITTYSQAEGLLDNNVYPVFEDSRGVVWVGTTSGIFKYQDGKFSIIKGSEKLYVDALSEDSLGRLLVSSTGGLFVLEENQFRHFYQSPLGVNWAIYPDRENALWIGSGGGLIRLKDNLSKTFTINDGLAGDNVKVIIDDKNGGMWIGSYGGLTHYKDGKFEKWTEADGLPTPTIRSLYLDADNVLWIGSYDSGLARFKDGKFTHYNTNNGLYTDGAFQILEDEQRNFWLSSNRGIYRVRKDELNELAEGKRSSINSVGYGKSDGMLNVEANGGRMPGGVKTRDGRLWFPTQDGVAVINPETIKPNPQPPPVVIESVKIDNKLISDFGVGNEDSSDKNQSQIPNPKSPIQIEPPQQNFEIQYTALSFINSENLRFKYKLEGLDSEWIEAGTRRTAYFSYVPPGDYTFRVIAANSDGVWNESGASLRIKILPPFYRTWWFLTIAVLSLMGLTFLIYRRRVSQLEREKKAQETLSRRLIELQEHERKRIAGELHDSLSQNLVIIKNRAMMSLAEPDNVSHAFEQIEEIAEAAAESLTEVREIAANLRPFQIDRLGLTKAIQSLIRKAASPNLQITSQIDDIDNILLPEMEINLYRILQESLNNIIKHSNATEATVLIEKTGKTINIRISDNGKGFETNTRLEDNESNGGFGLTGMSERARILGSTMIIESTPGNGALIRFQISYVNQE